MASQRARSSGKLKILLLGGAEVGKTETLYTHRLATPERDEIQLEILDSMNNPDDAQLETNIKWADAFILLYSVTDRESFSLLDTYLSSIGHLRHDDGPALVLVANKTDCPVHARRVTSDDGRRLAVRLDRPVYELSVAESPEGVARVVDDVIKQVHQRDVTKMRTSTGSTSPGSMAGAQDRVSAFTNVKRVLREKIYRGSRSDSWMVSSFDRLGK